MKLNTLLAFLAVTLVAAAPSGSSSQPSKTGRKSKSSGLSTASNNAGKGTSPILTYTSRKATPSATTSIDASTSLPLSSKATLTYTSVTSSSTVSSTSTYYDASNYTVITLSGTYTSGCTQTIGVATSSVNVTLTFTTSVPGVLTGSQSTVGSAPPVV